MKSSTEIEWIISKFKWAKNKSLAIINISDSTGIDRETIIEVLKDHGLYVKKDKCTICGETFNRYIKPICQDCLDRMDALAEKREARRQRLEFELCQLEVKRWSLLRRLSDFDRMIYGKKEAIKRLKNDPTHIEA